MSSMGSGGEEIVGEQQYIDKESSMDSGGESNMGSGTKQRWASSGRQAKSGRL